MKLPQDSPTQDPGADGVPGLRQPWQRIILGLVLVAVIALAVGLAPKMPLADWPAALQEQASSLGVWAPVAIIGLFYLFSVAALPTPLFIAASGATFGLWPGFLGIWVGYLCAVCTVWAISRWFAVPMRTRFARMHPDAERILAAIAQRGGWLVFLTQLHPLSPNGIFNWLYPSLGIKARQALPAIGLGRAPTLFFYTAIGAWSVEGLTGQGNGWWWLGSALIAVAVFTGIARLVSQALDKAMSTGSAASEGGNCSAPLSPNPSPASGRGGLNSYDGNGLIRHPTHSMITEKK